MGVSRNTVENIKLRDPKELFPEIERALRENDRDDFSDGTRRPFLAGREIRMLLEACVILKARIEVLEELLSESDNSRTGDGTTKNVM